MKLDTSNFGSGFCGSIIGKAKAQKMSIKQNCKIHTHAKKCVLDSDLLRERVFIGTKTKDSDSVFVEPAISPSLLGGN